MSKHIRISNNTYNKLAAIKAAQYDKSRFTLGDAIDKVIEENERLKNQVDWLMNQKGLIG